MHVNKAPRIVHVHAKCSVIVCCLRWCAWCVAHLLFVSCITCCYVASTVQMLPVYHDNLLQCDCACGYLGSLFCSRCQDEHFQLVKLCWLTSCLYNELVCRYRATVACIFGKLPWCLSGLRSSTMAELLDSDRSSTTVSQPSDALAGIVTASLCRGAELSQKQMQEANMLLVAWYLTQAWLPGSVGHSSRVKAIQAGSTDIWSLNLL